MSKHVKKKPTMLVSVDRGAKIRDLRENCKTTLERDAFAFQFDKGKGAKAAQRFYSYVCKEFVSGFPRLHQAAMKHQFEGIYGKQLLGLLSIALGGDVVSKAIVAATPDLSVQGYGSSMLFLDAGKGQGLKIASFLLTADIKGLGLQELGVRNLHAITVRKMVKELKSLIDALLSNSSSAYTDVDGIDDIQFFIGEYAKRRLLLDAQNDDAVSDKAHAAYELVRQVSIGGSDLSLESCGECAWFSSDAKKFASLPFVLEGTPCGLKECGFKRHVERIVDVFAAQIGIKTLEAGNQGQHETLCSRASQLEGLYACVELARDYGLYPYDLLVIPPASGLYADGQQYLPKSNFYTVDGVALGELWCGQLITFLKKAYESEKRKQPADKLHTESMNRIAGLWIWDAKFCSPIEKPLSLPKIIASLFEEPWLAESPLGRVVKLQLERVKEGKTGMNTLNQKFRDYYDMTDQGIRHSALVGIVQAKTMKRQRAGSPQ